MPALISRVHDDDLSDDEAMVLGLIENLQRESLTPIEAAAGLQFLADHYELTHAEAAKRIGKDVLGFFHTDIGTHSIRASGAMQLFLNDVSEAQLKKIRRWKSATWLSYIHSQIAAISEGLSCRMVRPVVYYNIVMCPAAASAASCTAHATALPPPYK